MKKLNITPRAKKTLIATGSALVCVGVVALIVTFNSGATSTPVQPEPASSTTSVDVSVGDISAASAVGGQSDAGAFIPSSGASQATELTEISKPSSTPPKPIVERDASTASNGTKTQPTNSALTNKNTKPSYTSNPTAPTSKPSSKPSSSTPSGGKPGQIYVPGFGWQYPTGGKGTTVAGDGDINKQVGIMD